MKDEYCLDKSHKPIGEFELFPLHHEYIRIVLCPSTNSWFIYNINKTSLRISK